MALGRPLSTLQSNFWQTSKRVGIVQGKRFTKNEDYKFGKTFKKNTMFIQI